MQLMNTFDLATKDEKTLIGLEYETQRNGTASTAEAGAQLRNIREALTYVRRQNRFSW